MGSFKGSFESVRAEIKQFSNVVAGVPFDRLFLFIFL